MSLYPTWPRGRTCSHCGVSFLAYSIHPRQRFCSVSCAKLSRSLPWIACAYAPCGIRFPPPKSNRRFCSVACSNRERKKSVA